MIPKIEFALGEEVSDSLFKSNFARSFVNCASKSLVANNNNNNTINGTNKLQDIADSGNNNYYSLDQRNVGDLVKSFTPDVQKSDEVSNFSKIYFNVSVLNFNCNKKKRQDLRCCDFFVAYSFRH